MSVIVFDHFLRHPVVTLGDDDERFGDEQGRLLDAHHPQIEDTIDWLFRDRAPPRGAVVRASASIARARRRRCCASRLPSGVDRRVDVERPSCALSQQLAQCLAQWLAARRLPLRRVAARRSPLEDMRDRGRAARRRPTRCCRCATSYTQLPPKLLEPLPRLAIPYLRVLAERRARRPRARSIRRSSSSIRRTRSRAATRTSPG